MLQINNGGQTNQVHHRKTHPQSHGLSLAINWYIWFGKGTGSIKQAQPIPQNHFFLSHSPSSAQTQQEASALPTILALPTRQVRHVGVSGQRLGNLLASIDLTNLDQAATSLSNSLADDLGTLGFTLSADNVRLPLLLGTLDDESCPFGVLLGDLLLLNGAGELLAEGHVGDGDVLEGDVELGGAAGEVVADAVGDGFTLGDELGGVELGDDRLEDFISNGGEDTFIVVCTVGLYKTSDD